MACATNFTIRNISRAVPISCTSSFPIISSVGNNGSIAQGKSLSKSLLQPLPQTFRQLKHISSLSTPVQTKNSVSSTLASKLFTTTKSALSGLQFFRQKSKLLSGFPKSRMATATFVIPEKSFSTAVLKPQEDALDETVDPFQRQLLEEQCIVLNDKDEVIGHDTKRNCHRIVNGDVLLHRAFSVFLFNEKGELLMQQRSKTKITFPLMWTNTCCSHPLYTPSELDENEAIGVRRAARRRLEIELGIPQDSISLDEFQYLTRIHYKGLSNSIWGEHEIDYILFLQKDNLKIDPSLEEIQEIRWVKWEDVNNMIVKENVGLTPWFELIMNSRLPQWWKNLDNLKQFEDHNTIHRLN